MKGIKFIKWWQCKKYIKDVSIVGWTQAYNEMKLRNYAIVLFDGRKYPELEEANNGYCAIGIEMKFTPTGTKKDKKTADKIEKQAIALAIKIKSGLLEKGKWDTKIPKKLNMEKIIMIHL